MITVVSKTQTIMVMILILQMMTAKMISQSDAIKMIVIISVPILASGCNEIATTRGHHYVFPGDIPSLAHHYHPFVLVLFKP